MSNRNYNFIQSWCGAELRQNGKTQNSEASCNDIITMERCKSLVDVHVEENDLKRCAYLTTG